MNKYRKLFAAILIGGLFVALKYYDIDIMGLDGVFLDLLGTALTAFGVYQVPNEPM